VPLSRSHGNRSSDRQRRCHSSQRYATVSFGRNSGVGGSGGGDSNGGGGSNSDVGGSGGGDSNGGGGSNSDVGSNSTLAP
jgi:hypothetical protein